MYRNIGCLQYRLPRPVPAGVADCSMLAPTEKKTLPQ
jgi:hypothetical protein